MTDDREDVARLIALAGLGTTDGSRRAMPENWGDEALWAARILECIPTEAAERCFELTDAILARQGPGPGEAVAWRWRHVPYVGWSYASTKPLRPDLEIEPLYAATPTREADHERP